MPLKNILFQDTPVFYTTMGNGSPVVLLHGFGEDSNIWQHQYAELQKHHYLIMPDIPGSGLSPALPGSPSIDDFAAVINAILTAEQINYCTVLGHSMGGYIALAMAEKYPSLLKALGLLHSSAYADTDAKKEARKKSIEFIQTNGAPAFLKTAIPGLFSEAFTKEHPAVIEALVKKGDNFTPAALVQYYKAMIARPDRTTILRQFAGPVLLLAGKHDTAVPFEQSRQQASLAAETHVCFLRNSAHMGMLEETILFNTALTDFLIVVDERK